MKKNPWLQRAKPSLCSKIRMICLPHAGGTAGTFNHWAQVLPDWIDVIGIQYPGRQNRMAEPMPNRMGVLVRDIFTALETEIDLPYILVGSCTGALIAYELIQVLQRKNLRLPSYFLTVSCRAPHMPDRDPPIHALDDEQLRRSMSKLGGTAGSIIDHPDMMRIFGPTLRQDFQLAETYTYRAKPPLPIPIIAFRGNNDAVINTEEIEAWQQHTDVNFYLHNISDGGHYLVEEKAPELCAIATDYCQQICA